MWGKLFLKTSFDSWQLTPGNDCGHKANTFRNPVKEMYTCKKRPVQQKYTNKKRPVKRAYSHPAGNVAE